MEIEVEGSRGNVYVVDTERVSCTCADFRFRCCHNQITSEARQCKHLRQIYKDHPELMPDEVARAMRRIDEAIERISNKQTITFPSALLESYLSLINSFISWEMSAIGDYAQGKQNCEDLTIIVKKSSFERTQLDTALDFIGQISEEDEEHIVVLADGYFPVKFLIVPDEKYILKLFFGTTKKETLVKLQNISNGIGISISPDGIIDQNGIDISNNLKSISDIYTLLNVKPENFR